MTESRGDEVKSPTRNTINYFQVYYVSTRLRFKIISDSNSKYKYLNRISNDENRGFSIEAKINIYIGDFINTIDRASRKACGKASRSLRQSEARLSKERG